MFNQEQISEGARFDFASGNRYLVNNLWSMEYNRDICDISGQETSISASLV